MKIGALKTWMRCYSQLRITRLMAAILGLCMLCGCGGQKADVVFDVKFIEYLSDGRPVIEVTPNGKPRPAGNGPFGDYFLVLRPDGSTPYTRQFDAKEAEMGARRDFAVAKSELAKFSRVTVSVENPENRSFDNGTLLSNVIEIPLE